MLYLKACPRCSGDVHLKNRVLTCYQCGFTVNSPKTALRAIDESKQKQEGKR